MTLCQVNEIKLDYTECTNAAGEKCAEIINQNPNASCDCTVPFELKEDWEVSLSKKSNHKEYYAFFFSNYTYLNVNTAI